MSELKADLVTECIQTLLREIYNGPANPSETWVAENVPDSGIIGTIARLTAKEASHEPIPGRSSVAGHVNHLCFSLDLLNRWAQGENPFLEARWEESWRVQSVTESEWIQLQARLRNVVHNWIEAVAAPREWDRIELTGAMASAAHAAYHLGALRQLAALAHA
jgi:hypothetical protein